MIGTGPLVGIQWRPASSLPVPMRVAQADVAIADEIPKEEVAEVVKTVSEPTER